MLVISSNLVLTEQDYTLDHPIIGYENVVTAAGIVADTEASGYPASNMANPATYLEWRANDTTAQEITITTGTLEDIDYVAIAKHNLGTEQIEVELGYYNDNSPDEWVQLVSEVIPADDSPLLLRFTAQPLAAVVLRLAIGDAAARIAVVYCGKLLTLQRKVYADHVPMPDGRRVRVANGRSEEGNFLGRIVLGQSRTTKIPLSLLEPDWFRAYMRPFLEEAVEIPFFFAWRPQSYPLEVGYGWLTNDPDPVNAPPSNLIALDLEVSGIV